MSGEGCLACDAARRDTMDLLQAVVEDAAIDSPRVSGLVSGMDSERTWRVLLFMAGVAGGLVDSVTRLTRLPASEVIEIFRNELTGVGHHEH